MKSSGLSLE